MIHLGEVGVLVGPPVRRVPLPRLLGIREGVDPRPELPGSPFLHLFNRLVTQLVTDFTGIDEIKAIALIQKSVPTPTHT